jgi:hypothetical protein
MKKKLLIVVAALLVLVIGAGVAAFFILDPKAMVAKKKDEVLANLSTKLGRQVTAGDVTASVGSQLKARIVNIQMAGPPVAEGAPAKPAQMQIGSVDMRFSLVRALFSFGQDLYVERFVVQGLTLRAARDAEGNWDFADIQRNLDAAPDDPKDDKKPGDKSFLEDLRIASMQIINGRIELDDKMLGRPLAVAGLNIDTSDVVLGDPLDVSLKASLEDAQRKSPIDVKAHLAVLPKDLVFDPLPGVDVTAKLMDVDLAPWGGLIPADVPAPVQGTLRTDVKASVQDDAKNLSIDGTLNARGLVLRDALSAVATAAERKAAPKGSPLDADLTIAMNIDQSAPRYDVTKLTLTGSGLDVKATIAAKGTSLADLEKADVQATAQDLNRLLSALPPSLRGLPEAVRIDGPLAARVIANGTEIDANVNLDNARVRYLDLLDPDASDEDKAAFVAGAASFDKPVGKPLNVTVHGKKSSTALDIDKLALVVDTAKIGGTLSIPTADGEPLVADITSGAVELVSLQGLVPPFKEAIGKGQKVAGTVELKVKATKTGGAQQADAVVDLRSLDVNLASTVVRGGGNFTLKAAPAGDVVDLTVVANLDGLSIQKTGEGGNLVVNKPAGLPLRLDVAAKKTKAKADVSKLSLAIGKSTINGTGVVGGLDQKETTLAIDLGNVALAFDDLRAAVPGASKLPPGGRLTGAVKLGGGTSTDKLVVDAKGANITFGSSRIAGDVNIKNLSDPTLDVKLPTIDLAFDDVRNLSAGAGDLPAGGRFKGSLTMTGDTAKAATVKAHVKIESLTAQDSSMKGAVEIENLDKPKFTLGIQADMLNVDRLRGVNEDNEPIDKSPKKKRENPHGLSKETREMLANVSGKGTITANKAIVKGIPVQKFKGVLTMTKGVARFDTLEFDMYGGSVTANGSFIDLPAERTAYTLKLKGKDIDMGAAVADQTDLGRIFTGRVSPDIKVDGKGLAARDFAITADGPAELVFKSLAISTLDFLGPIGEALGKSNKIPKALKIASPGNTGTALDGFKAATRFVGGRLKLEKPIETNSGIGKITWTGAAGLDAGLDLDAGLELSPATIAKMTGNKVKPKNAIPVPVKVGGTWDKPRITGVDVGKLATEIVKALGGEALDDLKDKGTDAAKDAAKDALGDLTGKNKDKDKKKDDKKKKTAAEKAAEEAKKLFGK